MISKVQFVINNKIEIIWHDGNYKSDIQNVTENNIAISVPIKDGKYIPLSKGEKITVFYYDEDNVYEFSTSVIGRAHDRIPIINIEQPQNITRVQRRNHVRVPLVADISCALIKKNLTVAEIGSNQIDFFNAFTLDMSGGGLKIMTKKKVSVGDQLLITVSLNNETLNMQGEIVRVDKDIENKFVCGVNFVGMDNKTNEKLIRIIFQIMREQAQRASKEE